MPAPRSYTKGITPPALVALCRHCRAGLALPTRRAAALRRASSSPRSLKTGAMKSRTPSPRPCITHSCASSSGSPVSAQYISERC
eukprot:6207403-Pleurochrysis_carterae.AAC.2